MSKVGLGAVLALAVAGCGGRTTPAPPAETPVSNTARIADAEPPSLVPRMMPATAPSSGLRPVEFQQLATLLPQVEGWLRHDDHGEQLTSPVRTARAEARYDQAEAHVELELADSTMDPQMLSPLAVFLAPGYSERSPSGFRRSMRLDGQPAFEDWQAPLRRGNVTLVVAGRFIVRAAGYGIDSLAPVRTIVGAVDVGALASLR